MLKLMKNVRRMAGGLGLMAMAMGVAVAAPPAPVMVIGVSGDEQVVLSWEPVAGAASYTVGRRASPNSGAYTTLARGITANTYTDSGLTNGERYFYVVSAVDADGRSGPESQQARAVPYRRPAPGVVRWPVANSTAPDADPIRYSYGPRDIGRYDFHGGIDINAPLGTPIYAIMGGTVTNMREWDGQSRGPGTDVLISHGDQMWSAYLHLDAHAPGLEVGQRVEAGDLIGTMGTTGARSVHLHMTFFVGLASERNNESRSVSPLEVLPMSGVPAVTAMFREDRSNTVDLYIPAQLNTIRWIMLQGEGQTRMVDYYDVVAQGSTRRDTQSQYGIFLDVARPDAPWPADGGTVHLWVRPDPARAFRVERIVVKDFNGITLIDQTRPPAPPRRGRRH